MPNVPPWAARAQLADAERVAEGEALRHERAQNALDETIDGALDEWTAAVEKAVGKSERDLLAALSAVEQAEAHCAHARTALEWLRVYHDASRTLPRLDHYGSPPSRIRKHPNDPACYSLAELLAGMRETVEGATLAAEDERLARGRASGC